MKQMILNKLQDLIYGKPQLIRTEDVPGMISVTILLPDGGDKCFDVAPKQEIWKRPRQKSIFMKGVYLKLPYAIPYPHVVTCYLDIEYEDKNHDTPTISTS